MSYEHTSRCARRRRALRGFRLPGVALHYRYRRRIRKTRGETGVNVNTTGATTCVLAVNSFSAVFDERSYSQATS
jgi:hypothetical protein